VSEKQCVVCGGTFTAHGSAKTCGKACAYDNSLTNAKRYSRDKQASRARIGRQCRFCGDSIDHRRNHAIICTSPVCRSKLRLEAPYKQKLRSNRSRSCRVCGNTFTPRTNDLTCNEVCREKRAKSLNRDKSAKFRQTNPERVKQYERKCAVAKREAATLWWAKNPEKRAVYAARGAEQRSILDRLARELLAPAKAESPFRQWRLAHPEKYLAMQEGARRRRLKHPEKDRAASKRGATNRAANHRLIRELETNGIGALLP